MWERIGDIVTFHVGLSSVSYTDPTSIEHGGLIISGLPAPRANVIFMANTFTDGDKAYRMLLNTNGTINAYWDTVKIPRNGQSLVINITYFAA